MLIDIKCKYDNHVSQIKALRGVTGLGLKETKDITDKLRDGEGPIEVEFANKDATLAQFSDFRMFFNTQEVKQVEVKPSFNFRNEVRKLAIKAIKADDLSAAKELLSLFA